MRVLITGGSRGIGAACVRALRDVGHLVAVASRSPVDCDYHVHADLSFSRGRQDIVNKVIDNLGGIDILVNNAGEQIHKPFTDICLLDWYGQIELLLNAPFDLSQQAARHMLGNGGGQIINILSTSAFQGARYIAPYIAAKHGLLGLTRAMAVELAPKIRVNAIAPGLVDTEMTAGYIPDDRRKFLESITPAGRFGTPEDIADALMFVIGNPYLYGQVITVDGGWCVKNSA